MALVLRQEFVRRSCEGGLRGANVSKALYNELRARVPNAHIPFMPTYDSVRRSAQRAVNRTRPSEPASLADLVIIPDEFQYDSDGLPFVWCFVEFEDEDGSMTKILCFGTERDFRKLCRARLVLVDGTFRIVPRLWNETNAGQFFSLSTFFGAYNSEHLYNRFSCLMSRRTSKAYQVLFEQIDLIAQRLSIPIEWESIKVDFESGLLPVLREFGRYLATLRVG